jgi:hypothetical protein
MSTKLATAVWLLLLMAVFSPFLIPPSADVGDTLIRNTIRLALLYYFVALNLMLYLRPIDWPARTARGRLARACWTIAWLTYLVHLTMAFHHAHHWSHTAAVEHTREVSGVGEGIYVSHFFTLVWSADVLSWWLRPDAYARRSPWIGRLLHGFMLFVVFNGTVVYEEGLIRWAGALAFVELAVAGRWRYVSRRPATGRYAPPHY